MKRLMRYISQTIRYLIDPEYRAWAKECMQQAEEHAMSEYRDHFDEHGHRLD